MVTLRPEEGEGLFEALKALRQDGVLAEDLSVLGREFGQSGLIVEVHL
jgi:hypothetical protein